MEGSQPTPQVAEGFAGSYRSGASSLQLVEQYSRFLKVLQEFSGSEPTNKGNDLKKERPETKGNNEEEELVEEVSEKRRTWRKRESRENEEHGEEKNLEGRGTWRKRGSSREGGNWREW